MLATRMRQAAAGASGAIFFDTFTDTNGTNITAHTPEIGGAYTVLAGSAAIEANELAINTAATVVSNDIGIDRGYTITITMITGTTLTAHAGVLVRVSASTNYVFIGHDNGGNNFILAHRSGGALTTVASSAFAFATNTSYTITVSINDDQDFTATLNGGNQITANITTHAGTNTIGVRAGNDANGEFDNLLVETL